MEKKVVIELQDVRRDFQVGSETVHALRGVSFKIYEGEFVTIMGTSGSGKSTLLNQLGCLDTPTSGEYLLDGTPVRSMRRSQRARLRNRKIGFVFQNYNLLAKTTAIENVELPLMYNKEYNARQRREAAIAALEAVGLGDRLEHKSNQMSGGQMQRVAIARALVNNPAVILADEATGNLDTRTSFEVLVLFQKLHAEGGLSQSDYEAAELGYALRRSNLENVKENTILRSPLTGYVSARNFDKGDMFTMAKPIFTIQQVVPVKLLVGVSEADYSKVKKGDKVSLTVDALPGRTFSGKVERLYPTINEATHTVSVEVTVPNTDKALRPGMYARVNINFGTQKHIVIPDQCIVKQQGSGQRFVFVLNDDNTVSYVPVELGVHKGTDQEIISGLSEGQKVVVKGQTALKDGSKVQVLEK